MIGLFAQGIGLGFGVGLCLAGAVGVLFRMAHGADPNFQAGHVPVYFLVVGGVLGLLGGWCLALQGVLQGLLGALFLKIAERVPASGARVGEEWGNQMEGIFRQVLEPLPGFFRKILHLFLIARFKHYERINEAVDLAKGKEPSGTYSPQWISRVILGYFLWPLRVFFYLTYAILFLIACLLWSFPFFR